MTNRDLLMIELLIGSADEKVIREINNTAEYETGENPCITLDEVTALWSTVQEMYNNQTMVKEVQE